MKSIWKAHMEQTQDISDTDLRAKTLYTKILCLIQIQHIRLIGKNWNK